MQRTLSFVLLVGLFLGLSLGLGGCGDTGGSSSGGTSAGSGTGTATPTGAKTPNELLDRMEAMAKTEEFDLPDMISLIHPDEQPAMAFMMSVIPLVMAPMMAAFAQGEEKVKMEAKLKEVEALLEKYNLDDAQEKMKGLQEEGADMSDEQKLAKLNGLMQDVDHMGLLRESWALITSMSDKASQSSMFKAEDFAKARASLKVEGDRATMDAPEKGGAPLVLVKASDGNWYISALKSGLLEN